MEENPTETKAAEPGRDHVTVILLFLITSLIKCSKEPIRRNESDFYHLFDVVKVCGIK